MRRRFVLIPLLLLILTLFAGCGGEQEPLYPGEDYIPYPLEEDFTINVLDTNKKFVKCKVTLEIDDASMAVTFDARVYRLNELVNLVIRSKTLDELNAPDIQTTLAGELAAKVNAEFNTETVKDAYFGTFYIY